MPGIRSYHRPLMSGVLVHSSGIPVGGGGTLTGLATRNSDDQKVLATNLHVMSHDWSAPDANAEMYQGFLVTRNRVGVNMAWIPLVEGSDIQQLRQHPAPLGRHAGSGDVERLDGHGQHAHRWTGNRDRRAAHEQLR